MKGEIKLAFDLIPKYLDPNKWYDRNKYTDDELISRVWDKEQIKNIVGRRAFYYANGQRERELSELWVQKAANRKTACFGRNWGYYIGMDDIKRYYVHEDTKNRYVLLDKLGIDADNKNLGFGWTAFHTATTPMIYIAGDGKTAKGLWYCPGMETTPAGDGDADALWVFATMGIDFIKEDGEWRMWHLVIANDYVCRAGECYQDGAIDEIDPTMADFGAPTLARIVHDPRYNWGDDFPFMPKPYQTFTSEISYGPEGNPYTPYYLDKEASK